MKDCNVHHMTTGGVCRDCGTPWSAMTANQHEDAVRVATPPTPDPRERGVNYAAMMAARDENERDAARVVDAYLADHGVRWSPGAAQMAADLLALEALRAPAPSEAVLSATDLAYVFARRLVTDGVDLSRPVKLTHEMVERAMIGVVKSYRDTHPAPARGVTEAMVVKAKMAMEGWRGDSHRYACLDLFRRGEDGMVRLHRALTAALTPDAEGGA